MDLCANVAPLEAKYRKAVAEIALIRGFDLLQGIFLTTALKLVCGAIYLDGTGANVSFPANSQAAALTNMVTHGRARPRNRMQWSKVSEIKKNCQFVIRATDHFLATLTNHSTLVDEMRNVRNRIAHNNHSSRRKYQSIVKRHYGAEQKHISPGTFLLTDRFAPKLIDRYLFQSKVLVKQVLKG
ncbi:MAG TPA: hypothetical protein VKJ65_05815 [Phycisphaerae bacterium]|nr:hypothetical protein [Phycisphaerae bacterium]